MKRDRRLPIVMSDEERQALKLLAHSDGLSAAGVLRRLLLMEARLRGVWPPGSENSQESQEVERD